ncbi:pyridoxamine 5'-phosphate oxidase family protein [Robiginitalea sediminis]|uniref:pyridoxamine 5'-phosphate oxidase family protein n=1 Tax=Robiginitalea sediminis TaxID=1982593 RepID=UPI000B4B837E|nr:pyridoxamine 5'-phosphate oxidase family protein [Robiginitalea sediminis]
MKNIKNPSGEPQRELTGRISRELLARNCFGSLAYLAHGVPYVLPITYFYDKERNFLVSYSMEGHKIQAMREHPEVALLVYEMQDPGQWVSVQVHGRFEEVRQIDAKACLHRFTEGVRSILKSRGEDQASVIPDFSSKSETMGIPVVYRIRPTVWEGRCRERD